MEVSDWRCPGHDAAARPPVELGDGYEVVVTRRGVYARECDGVGTVADAGVALFWHTGEEYRITHPVPGGDVCSIFRVSEDGLRDLLRPWSPAAAEAAVPRFPAVRVPLDGRTYLRHRLAMQRLSEGGDLRTLEGDECAASFVRAAVRAATRSEARGRVRPAVWNRRAAEYVARVREVLGRQPRGRLTLAGVAAQVGCSPFHLSRIVSAREGAGVYGLALQLRLRDALEPVLEGREPIGRIALESGFASHSHFDDAFRREFGCAPGALRRQPSRVRGRVLEQRRPPGESPR